MIELYAQRRAPGIDPCGDGHFDGRVGEARGGAWRPAVAAREGTSAALRGRVAQKRKFWR